MAANHLHLSGNKPKPYPYRPLGPLQIRLLELFSGPSDDRLRGSLLAVDLPLPSKDAEGSSFPSYEALSYHWGEANPSGQEHAINIFENNDWYHIKIRPNLFSALRRLRQLHGSRMLWVDALCINQEPEDDDIDERKIYVPRMDEVYNKATRVCIWLGEEGNDSQAAMELANQIQDFNPVDGFVKDAAGAKSLSSFAALLRRPWFTRRWVVQELAVAKEARLYCGDAESDWLTFSGAISLLISRHVDLRHIFRSSGAFNHNPDYLGEIEQLGAVQLVYVAANFFRKSQTGEILYYRHSLEEIVSRLITFEVHDPRDIIYAVLSLSNDAIKRQWTKSPSQESLVTGEDAYYPLTNLTDPFDNKHRSHSVPEGLQPAEKMDAHIDIKYQSTTFEVYKDFLKLVITNSGSIDIICRPWAAEDPAMDGDYPSWITKRICAPFGLRWNRAYSRNRADLLVGTLRNDQKTYRACGKYRAHWDYRDYTPLDKSLVVSGFVLDTVHRKLTPAMGGVVPVEWPAAWQALPRKKRPPGSFWRTIIADCSAQGEKPAPSYYSRAYDYAFEQRARGADFDTREMIKDIECPSEVQEYLERVQAVTWRRRFMVSREKMLIGLVPFETRKRDLICILAGCSVPVVLRRFETAAAAAANEENRETSGKGKEKSSANASPTDDQYHGKVSEDLDRVASPEEERPEQSKKDLDELDQTANPTTTDLAGLPRFYYQFIGECYIHGMMDGEAIGVVKPGGVEEEYDPPQGTKQVFWLR